VNPEQGHRPVIKFLHVVVNNTTTIALVVATQTTTARFDVKIAAIPGLSFSTLLFRTFEYFVYYPRCVAFFPRTCDKSDDSHLSSLHVWSVYGLFWTLCAHLKFSPQKE
jgi:hypothetical protein